ncbi:hypothetical protein [Pectobacterium carotovorum]|uniref:hypothetical protein n=2 Tax=Pectobacterium carotovorum TaxID=554 RepID=UPI0004FFF03B|nr:hypothetical protein [Pectobacterium carotovorum]KFW97740.1 hypothetical protein JV33_20550 [Pectobacterium carotovorum subsp. carotovorum]KML64986.1 hypothetical protein G032_21270 [Pectobacterium carotovorum subsp. carotovorum ICMP 5702]SHH69574.1 hypothetical protein SAMN05444147_11673 [Pectobacterium carotovorum]
MVMSNNHLREKIKKINLSEITYPDKERQVRCMNEEIANGKYDAADFRASNILQSLNNLSGITPLSLKKKLIKIHLNQVTYPDKERQIRCMNEEIANGKYDAAEQRANNIIQSLDNLTYDPMFDDEGENIYLLASEVNVQLSIIVNSVGKDGAEDVIYKAAGCIQSLVQAACAKNE